jgi:alkylhydroperoxidase/carboxymuconolactone decarboxylase family protein YurZ
MTVKIPWFVEKLEESDPEFFSVVKAVVDSSLETKALDRKTALLIVLALDAAKGAAQGVKVVSAQAREAGASEEEIREALRLSYYVAGMDVVKTSLSAFERQDE